MKLTRFVAAGAAVLVCAGVAWGAGIFQTYPIIGGAAYCASTIGQGSVQAGPTGFGAGVAGAGVTTGAVICGQTVPAGPATFAGTEVFPVDLYTPGTAQIAGGAATALVNINQVGGGSILDSTQTTGAVTIPNNTQFFFLDTGTPTTVAVTMPAGVEGQLLHITCFAAVSVAFSIVPAAGQGALKGTVPATCTAGTGFVWRFSGVVPPFNGTAAAIAANTWVRIQ
jgi:hypothetical protein